jgi:hypothetical protein
MSTIVACASNNGRSEADAIRCSGSALLPDRGLAQENERPVLTPADVLERPVQRRALAATPRMLDVAQA